MVSGGIIKQRFSRRGEFVLRHHTNHTENTDIVNQIIKISKIYKPAEISKKGLVADQFSYRGKPFKISVRSPNNKNLKGIMWNPILFLLLIFTEGNYENEVSTQKPLTPGGSGLLTRHVFEFFSLKNLIY